MLDDLNELRTFRQVLAHGSLTGAGRAMGVSLAVVSKRLATLEKRVGVRLVNRTTRSLSATEEGERLLVEVDRALEAIAQGEELLATGRDEPVGTLRVSAPVSFGRRHVAPVLGELVSRYPQLASTLSLDDRLVDVAGGTIDVAVRIGGHAAAGSAAMRKLADNRRILVAAPAYLGRRGRPRRPPTCRGTTCCAMVMRPAPGGCSVPPGRSSSFPPRPACASTMAMRSTTGASPDWGSR